MCNLYIMYYTDAKDGTAYQTCTDACDIADFFPLDSDEPLPPNPLLEEHALHGNHAQTNETITINNKMSINLVCLLLLLLRALCDKSFGLLQEQLQYDNVFGTDDDPSKLKPEAMKKDQSAYVTNPVSENELIRKLPEGEPTEKGGTKIELRMPGIIPQKVIEFSNNFDIVIIMNYFFQDDDYLCSAFDVQDVEKYITQYKIEGSADRAHHMLLYGCGDVPSEAVSWYKLKCINSGKHILSSLKMYRDCGHHGVCKGHSSIMFAWAKNAPPTTLPPSVGFRFGGPKSPINYLVLQIHYAHTLPPGEKDYSGMDITVTTEE